ncbi:hypothetical protein PMZ80_006216 [Knufia obscura]|uniref:Uncharacterized protein n=1 Tax=Knufia obscura TaxID=1635080 RepID=A0ABR0RL43_9EURO|nr:hypothetical protein PMZ80_006216 [Knufia obscura]
MWPLWLILAVALGGISVLGSAALLTVYIERKRRRKLVAQGAFDRNVSQYHRPHLSIKDVDYAALPRPTRSLRQSIVSPRRDSRFYSTMPSEDEIRTFPDCSAESVAEASYVHTSTGADRSHQWLSPSKSGKKDKRKKKAPVFSISAPMARSPLSAVIEVTESERAGSPEPVELPAHTTPKVTPEKPTAHLHNPMPSHGPQSSFDSMISNAGKNSNRVSQRISHGNTLKSRSISMGSINASPPDCPLPPVPQGMSKSHSRNASASRTKPIISTQRRDISLLNTPLSTKHDNIPGPNRPNNTQVKASNAFSDFDFGLEDGTIQIIRIEAEQSPQPTADQTRMHSPLRSAPAASTTYPSDDSFKTIDASRWNLPRGLRHLGPSTPNLSANSSESGSRPISAVSLTSYNGFHSNPHTPSVSPSKMSFGPPSRPVSISSVDIFRNSIVGPNAPVLAPESPRSRGHKRQNCVRISGLTPVDAAKKRLSSQLRRLSEAEETDFEDNKSMAVELPATSPVKSKLSAVELPVPNTVLEVPKVRQPQALSLRVKRPGVPSVRDKQSTQSPQLDTNATAYQQQPNISPQHYSESPLTASTTIEPPFRYQGSPASDPTRAPPPKQEYSPVSPSPQALTPEKKQPQLRRPLTYSPASPSMLNSPVPSSTGPRRNKTQLHGPRNIPPPSLHVRNKTSPALRQGERSGSPIRKTSSSNHSKQRSTSQDDMKRSLALLKTLTHAAQSGPGLPEVNIVKSNPADRSDRAVSKLPPSRYAEFSTSSASTQRPRQRSKTVGGRPAPSMFEPPRTRPEMAFVHRQQQQQQQQAKVTPPVASKFPHSPSSISIYEDVSVKSDSPEVTFKAAPQPISHKPTTANRTRSRTVTGAKPTQPAGDESLRRVQQNADAFTSRALAVGGNSPKMHDGDYRDRKMPSDRDEYGKVQDAHSGPRTQPPTSEDLAKVREQIGQISGRTPARHRAGSTTSNVRDGWATATATGYGAPGPRKRSHTIAANPRPVIATEMKMKEGVGLGVDFGRTGLATTFLNDMERDGIGRLR